MVIGTMCNLICDTVIIFCNLRSWFFIFRRDLKMELGMIRIIIVLSYFSIKFDNKTVYYSGKNYQIITFEILFSVYSIFIEIYQSLDCIIKVKRIIGTRSNTLYHHIHFHFLCLQSCV